MLHGVLIQEGRAASVRAEVFAPGALVWASDGIALRAKHLGVEDSRADSNTAKLTARSGSQRPASAALVAALEVGRKFLSNRIPCAERNALRKSGVREIQQAFLPGAALVEDPEYKQALAEVRARRRMKVWL